MEALDSLHLRAKDLDELKPKERRQKIRRMRQKGQSKIIKGVPYYDIDHYKEHVKIPEKYSKARNFRKAQKRVDAMVEELSRKYHEPEYKVWVNPATGRGADIVVEKRDSSSSKYKPYEVYELTNYTKDGYISEKDMERYVKTLKRFNCKRKLIVSYEENLYNKKTKTDYRKLLQRNRIEVEVKGEIPLEDEEEGYSLWQEDT